MRPLTLRIENLAPFRGPQPPLDFSDGDLVAITGPTGSGKSSLLDAMVFALYGQIPRMGKTVSEMIALGRERMAVTLDFRAGDRVLRVTRTRRRGGASEAQLDEVGPRGETPIAQGIKAVDGAVARIVGLSYEAFIQSVILPQGEFARFLRSPPRDRREILRHLLRLDHFERMRQQAQTEAAQLLVQFDERTRTLELFSDATPEAVVAMRAQRDVARDRVLEMEGMLRDRRRELAALRVSRQRTVSLEACNTRLAALFAEEWRVADNEGRLQTSRRATTLLPIMAAAGDAAGRAREAEREARATEHEWANALEAQKASRKALETALRAAGQLPQLRARLENLTEAETLSVPTAAARERSLEARRSRDCSEATLLACREDERGARQESGELQDAADAASVMVSAAHDSAQRAASALTGVQRVQRAALLRGELRLGVPCPVCEQPVTRRPLPLEAADLQAAEAAYASAQSELAEVSVTRETTLRRLNEAITRAAVASSRAASLETALRDAEQRLQSVRDALASLESRLVLLGVDPSLDPATERARLSDEIDRLETAVARCEAQALATAAALQVREEGRASSSLRAEAAGAEEARAWTSASAALLEGGFETEAAVRAASLRPEGEAELVRLVETHRLERRTVKEEQEALALTLGGRETSEADLATAVAGVDGLEEEAGGLRSEEARLAAAYEMLEGRAAQVEILTRERGAFRARHSVSARLASDLKSDRFQAWLLEDAFGALVGGASIRLLALSNRYSLEMDGEAFWVVDHDNAGERRSADTLSGGETFLASLALALELSEQVQQAAGALRLGSLFIDEGFGTLDPETLDAVTSVLFALPCGGRLVGIITHIPELTERIPHRILVERRPEGSRASWVGP